MGKSKKKTQEQLIDSTPTSDKEISTSDSIQAAYNELNIERQKLEKQIRELEEQCARSQIDCAPLDEDIASLDSLFIQTASMSELYKSSLGVPCCIEWPPTPNECEHEVCERQRDEGVTLDEKRVINDFLLRLHDEKVEWRRDVIRKDRDSELARVKREQGDGQSSTKLRTRFGNQSDSHYWAKTSSLEDDFSLVESDRLSTIAKFQAYLRERLHMKSTVGDPSIKAASIIDYFLSVVRPENLGAAITELKDILQLAGPMCDELQETVGMFEAMFGISVSNIELDEKQECASFIDIMEKMKENLQQGGIWPDDTSPTLRKFLQECIDLETEARLKMSTKCVDGSVADADLLSALTQIEKEYVAKSSHPFLTSRKLDADIVDLLNVNDVRNFLAKATSGASATELEAHITSLVITRAQKNKAVYVEKLEKLSFTCHSVGAREGSEMVRQAIANVLDKMRKWVSASESKKQESGSVTTSASGQPISATAAKIAEWQETLRVQIKSEGLWATFDRHYQGIPLEAEPMMINKADSYKETARALVKDEGSSVTAAVCALHQLKLCPGMVAVLISQALLDILTESPEKSNYFMKQFASCMDPLPAPVSPDWSKAFQSLALAMTQLYIAVYVEALAMYPNSSPLYSAISAMANLTRAVHLTRSANKAHGNFKVIDDFLVVAFSHDMRKHSPVLDQAMRQWNRFCHDDTFRCLTTGACPKHMRFRRVPHDPSSVQPKPVAKSIPEPVPEPIAEPPPTQETTPGPVSLRMLAMLKHLTALRGNELDHYKNAEEISVFNKEHGQVFRDMADALAKQVASYIEFAEQIAEWNEDDLAKEGFNFKEEMARQYQRLLKSRGL